MVNEDKNYYEASIMCIIKPQFPKKDEQFYRWVTDKSPKWMRAPVVQIRRYQANECHDGMLWNCSDEGWKKTAIYTFVEWLHNSRYTDCQEALIGAVGFDLDGSMPSLAFCWIHPFFRRKGKLTRAWPEFKEKIGQFWVESPNKDMTAFLDSVGYKNPYLK